tara:strand:- start:250 stop:495 length:246 start_codon:yes stop_codon:yes gene_type:complete
MKKLIKTTAIYFLSLKIIIMTVIIISTKKHLKNVKAEYKQCLCTVEKANWFLKEIPESYETMEHDVMNYDWGREIIIYFKY